MVVKATLFLLLGLSACSSTLVQYPSVCASEDTNCKRNLNAKTLYEMGYKQAALDLICKDPDVSNTLSECSSSGE